ncbi:MAG: extracellular solute-binding protein, partial [Victivallales bacterium]|nr:extracellular solute-binding protein [Victivallales bacterium]
MNKRKLVGRMGVSAILAFLICATTRVYAETAETTTREPVELRVSIPPPGSPRREIYDLFLKQNPDVVFIPGGGISITGMASGAQFYMAMAGGTAPDVFYMSLEQVQTYLTQNFLYPIEEIAGKNDPLITSIKSFVKPILIKDGHVYGIPLLYKAHGMAYRKDLFAKAGLPQRTPRNWDELFEFALRLEDPEKGVAGYAIYGGNWLFAHFLWEAGGEFLTYGAECYKCGKFTPSHDGKSGLPAKCASCGAEFKKKRDKVLLRCSFQKKPGQMALNFYRRLLYCRWAKDSAGEKLLFRDLDINTGEFIDKAAVLSKKTGKLYKLSSDGKYASDGTHRSKVYTGAAIYVYKDVGQDVFQRFLKGRLGFMIESAAGGRAGRLPDYNPAIVGLGSMPIGPSGKAVTIANAGCWGINSQIDDDKKEAAWRFIKFLCGNDAKKLQVKAMVERGQAAFVLPEYLELAGYSQYIDDVPKEWIAANKELEKVARAVPNAPGWRMVDMKIDEIEQLLITDPTLDIPSNLKKRAEECDRILDGQMGAG